MSIGEALAEARNRIGLTISEVSERTRVRETIIRDIERDDYSSCGADFYARGHIRAIARVVNIDAAPLIEEYDQAHGWQSGGDLPHPSRPTDYTLELDSAEATRRPFDLTQISGRTKNLAAVLALAVVVALGVVTTSLLSSPPTPAKTRPPAPSASRPTHPRAMHPRPSTARAPESAVAARGYSRSVLAALVQ